jgi:hypothetical protein
MLERHGPDRGIARHVAHEPHETRDRTDIGAPGRKCRKLGADIESLALHADRHF